MEFSRQNSLETVKYDPGGLHYLMPAINPASLYPAILYATSVPQ
jgi:hypothetical protein